jgi:hypothetical protein
MDRETFILLLARSVRDKAITEQEAVRLLNSFDAGELELKADELPLPPDEAIRPATESDITRAITVLLAIGALKVLHRRRSEVRETLQDALQIKAATLARRYAETGDLKLWQESFRAEVVTNIIQQRAVGAGKIPTVAQVSTATLEQSQFVARFAEQIALKQLAGEPLSYFQMAARSALYSGAGRAESYKAEAELYEPNTVVEFISQDDDSTCSACIDAEGVYRITDPFPTPGSVCSGYGNCRCTLEFTEGVAA